MAEQAPTPKRVAVLSPDGQFGTVDEADAEQVARAGGRVLSSKEVAQREVDERYEAKPLANKVAGYAQVAGLALNPVLGAAGLSDDAPPTLAAFGEGTRQGLTANLAEGVTRQAIDAFGTHAQGDAYARRTEQAKEASPLAHGAGQVLGMGVGAALGAATPAGLITGAGELAEQAAARGLGGLAARGALGRAAATGLTLAARGGVEGALMGATDSVGEAMLGDHELAADKTFAAMGMGALLGAGGGLALGTGGSLLKSGAGAVANAATGSLARVLGVGREVQATAETAAMRARAAVEEGKALAGGLVDDAGRAVRGVADDAAAKADAAVAEAKALGKDAVDAGKNTGLTAIDEAKRGAGALAEVTGTKADQELAALRAKVDDLKLPTTQKDMAYEQAWKAIGAGNGLQSTQFAKRAERYLPNGVKDVGEVLMRKGILNPEDGLMAAARGGTPADMLPKIEMELEKVGQRIGDITAASPAKVSGEDVVGAVMKVAGQYDKTAATRPVARALWSYGQDLFDSLRIGEYGQQIPVQRLLDERKALDKLVFGDAPLDAKMGTEVKRELRSELEGLITKALDDASGEVPGKLKAEYQALKKDYTALSIASEAAEDSAARASKARSISLTDYIAGGGSVATTLAHKVVRERGNAAAAVLLYRMAEMGTLTRAIQGIDDAVTKAARGVLQAPKPGASPDLGKRATEALGRVGAARGKAEPARPPVQERAKAAMERVLALQANPQQIVDHATRSTEGLSQSAPQLAGALTQRMTDAVSFLASKLPPQSPPDVFDPHPRPKMNATQAMEFARYADYVTEPRRFFDEAARGQITFEGVEVAKALMPKAFGEMQVRVAEGLADMLARGQTVPLRQRERLGLLMDIPAVPSQRPDHAMFLQGNVANSDLANQTGGPPKGGPSKSTAIKSPASALDRLEGGGVGRK